MMDHQLPFDSKLLSLCAVLRWFDHDILRRLADDEDETFETLPASDLVIHTVAHTDVYMLRDDVRATVLADMRANHPLAEFKLQTRAFTQFLNRMREGVDRRRAFDEESCIYHLDRLFLLLASRRDWHTLAEAVESVRSAEPQQARSLHQLTFYEGYVAIRLSDYRRGEHILNDLLQQPDLEGALRMQVLNALGSPNWYQGRYDRAIALYRQAHQLACETSDRFYQGITLLNMSQVYNEISLYDQALEVTEQSLEIFRALGDQYREAWASYDIGRNATWLGRWYIAQKHFQEAIRLHEMLDNRVGLASSYWGQGYLLHMLGKDAQSEESFLKALTVSQSLERDQPSLILDIYAMLGFLYQTQGHWNKALDAYDRAGAFAARVNNRFWQVLIDYRRSDVFRRQGLLDEAAIVCDRAIVAIESVRSATEAEDIKIGLLGTTQQVYEAMALMCYERGQHEAAFNYVERARSRAFLDTLVKKSPELYAAIEQPVVTLADVQAQLPEGALLVEYFTTGVTPRGEHLINMLPSDNAHVRDHLVQPATTLIFAVSRDTFEVHRAAIDPNVLRPMPNELRPGRRFLRGPQLVYLYEKLIEPLAHLLAGRELLYLIPHGPLHYVPFMALRSKAGRHLLETDGPAVALAPSATILLRTCLSRPRNRGAGLLALGYNDQGERELRVAEVEARHVDRALGGGGQVWIGPQPKSRRLIEEGRAARYVHIATHAIYNPTDPLGSELRLGLDDSLDARTVIGALDLQADLVTISACTSGLSHAAPGDELLGLQRAFLYAGASTVVCTLWEAPDIVALLVMNQFYARIRRGQPPAAALRDAVITARQITGRELAALLRHWRAEDPEHTSGLDTLPPVPEEYLDSPIFSDPEHWAPFMLIGRPD
jgi:CHAT domain-containing protein